jgi:hypothetical protein
MSRLAVQQEDCQSADGCWSGEMPFASHSQDGL